MDSGANSQNAPPSRQQRGKLSSLGKLFKPWKWRKKKTSEDFQVLTKGEASCVWTHYIIIRKLVFSFPPL